jgi:hypothetical protein
MRTLPRGLGPCPKRIGTDSAMTAGQAVRTLEEIAPEEETSESTRVLRASGIAGVLATIISSADST